MGNKVSSPRDQHETARLQSYFDSLPPPVPAVRTGTRSPVHPSLRQKKRSLELPDVDLQPDEHPRAIAIPARNYQPGRRAARQADMYREQMSTLGSDTSYTPPPEAPPSSMVSSAGMGTPPHLAPEPSPYQTEIVRSGLPLPLAIADPTPDPVIETPIVWNGPGTNVFVAPADGDSTSADALIPMARDGERFVTNVSLTRGTHHLRFVVDDQSLVSDDMPKAVDDQGALANYVSVGLGGSPPPPPPALSRGHSFWSTSSIGGPLHSPLPTPEWTSEIPLELTEAAAEEDAFIASYNANSVSTTNGRRRVINGFNIAPNPTLPPAPMLPPHLEKLILNSGNPSSSTSSSGRRSRHGHGHGHSKRAEPMPSPTPTRVLPVTTASGTDISTASSTAIAITPIAGSVPSSPLSDSTVIADDNSILPVPSHVVLNHLCTANIRNGVLALSDTVRYKNKYITTIYYKPT